ncbi:tRNA (5-methylaminomethyl-2-thiouridine)(34)-methyltransferase MnmD [Parvularcula sp. LCG005]|uniref:tRNA (5-methylaminomethyl-2-thiouridine)(34)-methyltransferase MnmD n=1 Tax=Parvularcula sp. LCG005 TaxID=3078805 RepID=UPI002942FC18|nr:tRNA (5-methylaminomethyl-2-thiouridine)(34)-methyltransferase MnmD [Parvularcula sp. LCG005]WOI53627.1 tRNA (5-methylaminomethyl-2-thiouridine)(34)-methyltransferase MnmD [Parvularcula sp. LCG005]
MTRLTAPSLQIDGMAIRSTTFGDIYFQPEDGLAEVRHVFLDGNDLPDRFAALTPGQHFVIGELGFGTGLNCLAAAALFLSVAPTDTHLSLWSAEAHPLPQSTLQALLGDVAERWPELAVMAHALRDLYPPARPGLVQLRLHRRVTLTIAMGSAVQGLEDSPFKADAFFLDGFAPSTNPDMWSPELMALVAQHIAPGGTLSTFTVAGTVRRALADAGIEVDRTPGFGRKRQMLRGRKPGEFTRSKAARVAIAGAGIAGASLSWHLQRAGIDVMLQDPSGAASGASGNPIGLLMPRLDASTEPQAYLYRDAFLSALRFYNEATPDCLLVRGGHILDTEQKQQRRFQKVLENGLWADGDLVLTPDAHLHVPAGATLKAAEAVRLLISDTEIADASETEWLTDRQDIDCVIFAVGPQLAHHVPLLRPDLTASRGQLDWWEGPGMSTIRTNSHYIAPWADGFAAGATYDVTAVDAAVEANGESSAQNRHAALRLSGLAADKLGTSNGARAAKRAVTTDRHPICGPVVSVHGTNRQRSYVLGGLGSRGLSTAPLLAAHLTAMVTETISPLTRSVQQMIAADRFEQRRQRRQT